MTRDVAAGYVSLERARRDYGVVLTEPGPGEPGPGVDAAATEAERRRRAADGH